VSVRVVNQHRHSTDSIKPRLPSTRMSNHPENFATLIRELKLDLKC